MSNIKYLIPEVFSGEIYYYDSILENPENIVKELEGDNLGGIDDQCISDWHEWSSSDGDYVFGSKRDAKSGLFGKSTEENKNVYSIINEAMVFASNQYAQEKSITLGRMSDISINRYDAGKNMGPHTDTADNAQISVLLYLNDDYENGEIEFPRQDTVIKPKAGSIIVFPSLDPYTHDPKPATSYRYVCTAFWYSA